MKQNKIKLGYQKPQTEIMSINSESFLLDSSFHSQHNPAQSGGSMGDAKQAPSWLSEGEDEDENPSWED